MQGTIENLFRSDEHSFSKFEAKQLQLLTGIGVEGDAHSGAFVKHRSRVAENPMQVNLRQVHLMAVELLEAVKEKGFDVPPGALGENVTTRGLDLVNLPRNTVLAIGNVMLRVEGLRNPCKQIEAFQKGLLAHMFEKDETGKMRRKAGIMATVMVGGSVDVGDNIVVHLPSRTQYELEAV